MDSSYLKLMKGSRLTNYMGLQLEKGAEPAFGKNYLYLEIGPYGIEDSEGSLIREVKRNQHVFLQSVATVNVKGRNIVEVEPNPALSELGQVQGSHKIHPDSGEQRVGVWFTARKDMSLDDLKYLVRIYMIG